MLRCFRFEAISCPNVTQITKVTVSLHPLICVIYYIAAHPSLSQVLRGPGAGDGSVYYLLVLYCFDLCSFIQLLSTKIPLWVKQYTIGDHV